MANSQHAQFILKCKQQANGMMQSLTAADGLVAQNAAVGNDYYANMASGDITQALPNSSLTVAQFQAFLSYYQILSALRAATDSTTFGTLIAQLTTAADAIYALSPPVSLDSLIIVMAGA